MHSNNSGDDEERNPPKGNLENPHKLKVKRKRTNSQQEGDETHAPEDDLLLDNMDLDVDIENITFPDVEVSTRENVQHISALMIQDETFSDEETFIVQNASFDKESKKLVFERTTKSKRGKLRSTIDTRDMLPSKLSSIHKVTGDALDISIAHMEEENAQLKERIKELEETLMPPPILDSPIAMIRPGKGLQENPEPSARVKGISNLIQGPMGKL
jgi:hypothetical protein